MAIKVKHFLFLLPICFNISVLTSQASAAESEATRLLNSRTAEFDKNIIKVSENVYTAVGYGVSPVSMIIGKTGIVIVDTGISVESGQQIREDFRRIVDKPVAAVIYTHGHGDHTLGASAFIDSPDAQVWAREGFGSEQNALGEAGIQIQKRRGAMQAGFQLSKEQRVNNGVAKAYWPDRKADVFSAGDNFYKSWPNLYAIRGTQYRDVRKWANVLDQILQEHPVAVVGGHTRPIIGEDKVNETLTNFRDAIRFLFNKTVEGINKGLTPNQLVDYVTLPEKYQNLDYLRPYYGNPEWAVRAIFDGYLGWFDGNATNLFPLSDNDKAERFAKVAGGVDGLQTLINQAIEDADFQWAAELCDYVLVLEPNNKQAMENKADVLTALSDNILTATARNYYLSSALALRKLARK
ncbi:alkyl/aryl-sulfatase [Paraglaciecola polaris]|uniref:Alkyl sulfatase or beta-lactamase n=1 Tax=Paraglaciecola polaris LMG 21857 TaxID=1129793 RepID=K6ZAJ0_9ALTE|nr:alkyl/aryl-sulfatase [Paraglaciecola polaris]GAC33146.1 alkyl sulfatase or beta-lactamase [Paraglaciecola polaris LMG 21857]